VAVLPVGVAHDGVASDRIPRQALRVQGVGARDDDDAVDLIGVEDRPLQRLHPAQRAAGDGGEPVDAELGQEGALGADHVGDGDDGKIRSVMPAGRRVDRRRTGRAPAAAE
jgi:hypothetical protein